MLSVLGRTMLHSVVLRVTVLQRTNKKTRQNGMDQKEIMDIPC